MVKAVGYQATPAKRRASLYGLENYFMITSTTAFLLSINSYPEPGVIETMLVHTYDTRPFEADVTWSPPEVNGCPILYYQVTYVLTKPWYVWADQQQPSDVPVCWEHFALVHTIVESGALLDVRCLCPSRERCRHGSGGDKKLPNTSCR